LTDKNIICNDCKKRVKYINTRLGGTVKCDPNSVKAYQESGRIVEVYLIHECSNNRSSDETLIKEAQERKLWTGPDTH